MRELHRPMHGTTAAAGTTFNVGGHPLHYPGEPVGPPEVWINCRCTLDTSLTAGGDDMDGDTTSGALTIGNTTYTTGTTANTIVLESIEWGVNDELDESPAPDYALIAVSDKPWSQFSASDYTIQQWRRACLLRMPGGDPEAKSTYKLPVREPGGALNRNGVHAAAAAIGGARGGVNAPAAAKAAARSSYAVCIASSARSPPTAWPLARLATTR